jgi:hypothetical protein
LWMLPGCPEKWPVELPSFKQLWVVFKHQVQESAPQTFDTEDEVSGGDDDEQKDSTAVPQFVELEEFSTIYYDSIFSDEFMKFMSSIHIAADRQHLRGLVSAFLSAFHEKDMSDTGFEDEDMLEVLTPVVKAFRALNSVLSPVPGEFGSTSNDVAFLFPRGKSELKIAADRCTKFGKSLMQEIANNKEEWQKLVKDYRDTLGTESACAEDFECRLMSGF